MTNKEKKRAKKDTPPATPLEQCEPAPKPISAARIVLGALALLAALAALVSTVRVARAEYGFRGVYDSVAQASRTEKFSRARLQGYVDQLAELCRLDPTNGEIRNLYATMLGNLGRMGDPTNYQKAVQEIETARKTLNNRRSILFLADMYERMGDIPRAEAAMADCLLINPTDVEFNPAWLHLLMARLAPMNVQKTRGQLKDVATYDRYRNTFAQAANNWAIRASNDHNSYLFLANYYIDPLYAAQAYKLFLVGLSRAPWLTLSQRSLLDERLIVQDPIRKIIGGRYTKPYRNLP